jgi:alpha-1,3-fucosyltransferase
LPHSYINAADFVSPKALAEYLYVLDTNPILYSKYFDWKVIENPTNGWCDLCEKLNNHPEKPNKSYEDVGKWYYDKVPCPSWDFHKETLRGTLERPRK